MYYRDPGLLTVDLAPSPLSAFCKLSLFLSSSCMSPVVVSSLLGGGGGGAKSYDGQ